MNGPDRRVVLLGGSSEIGLAIVRRLAAEGPLRVALGGRDESRLRAAAAALATDGIGTTVHVASLDTVEGREDVLDACLGGGADVVIAAVGALGAQAGLDADPAEAAAVMHATFVVCGALALGALRRLRDQGSGTLVVLSSVAGERVRASNAVYGAAKAGLDGLSGALGDAVAGTAVRVLVVRPGFVVGRMTAGLPRAPLATTPDAVGAATVRALARREETIWVPGPLRWVMAVLDRLPRRLWRRLPL